jgi:hypothetical protein
MAPGLARPAVVAMFNTQRRSCSCHGLCVGRAGLVRDLNPRTLALMDMSAMGPVLASLINLRTYSALVGYDVKETWTIDTSAQDCSRVLPRDFVEPTLRTYLYEGSGGDYKRTSGEYLISISLAILLPVASPAPERPTLRPDASVRPGT